MKKNNVPKDEKLQKEISIELYSRFFNDNYLFTADSKQYTFDDYFALLRLLETKLYIPDLKLPSSRIVKKRITEIEKALNFLKCAPRGNPYFLSKTNPLHSSHEEMYFKRLLCLFETANISNLYQDSVSLYFFPLYIGLIVASSKESSGWKTVKDNCMKIALDILSVLKEDIKIRIKLENIPLDTIYSNLLNYYFPDSLYKFIIFFDEVELQIPNILLRSTNYDLKILKTLSDLPFLSLAGENIFFKQALKMSQKYVSSLQNFFPDEDNNANQKVINVPDIGTELSKMHFDIYSLELSVHTTMIERGVNHWRIGQLGSRIINEEKNK